MERTSDVEFEILPKLSDNSDGRWRWGKDTANKRLDELTCRIVRTRNEYDVFQKDYLNKNGVEKRIKPKSFWQGSEFSAEAGTLELKKIFSKKVFETPKSSSFINYILQQSTDKNSIILDSFAGSGTTAHAVLNLNKEDNGNRKFILIEMEDYANTITAERVRRVINGYGEDKKAVAGTGGSFDYYELGKPIFKEDQNLNEEIGEQKIREYIYYTETKQHLTKQQTAANKYLLDSYNQTAYYFYYEKYKLTTLSLDTLNIVKTKEEQYIIYADNCLIDKEYMLEKNLIFKKIPRDIKRF